MRLIDYLAREQLSASAFATRLGVPASTIIRVLNGQRSPRLDTLEKIRSETNGEVCATDFMSPLARPRAGAREALAS